MEGEVVFLEMEVKSTTISGIFILRREIKRMMEWCEEGLRSIEESLKKNFVLKGWIVWIYSFAWIL